jgi:transposase
MEKEKNGKLIPKKYSAALPVIRPHAAGIDIGDTLHHVAIVKDGVYEVREFTSFTEDLKGIVCWLIAEKINTVAIESTGVYWVALYIMLEEAGIEVYLVNAKHTKNVSGRKQDDTDAIWAQKLHSCGLLQKSFQPENEQRVLRNYVRQRKNLITIASDSVRRMQKALELMNIKLHVVISDILGKTGMQMVEGILSGERNPEELAKLTDPRIKASKEDIIKSLQGIWSREYVFMLQQAYDEYQFYQKQVKDCEKEIEQQLIKQVAKVKEGDITDIVSATNLKKKVRKNQFSFAVTPYLKELAGVDITKIPGISEITAIEFIAEVGIDMNKWKSSKHFAAWLNLAPNTKKTGGKIISSKIMRKKNKAGQSLKMAASSLSNSKAPLGDYYRRIRAKLGGKGATLATAHKLARIIYTMLKNKIEFNTDMLNEAQEKYRQQRIKNLEKQLAKLKKAA